MRLISRCLICGRLKFGNYRVGIICKRMAKKADPRPYKK
jgi:hypothetical protein